MQSTKNIKPLGKKAYGSIPHLPGSRLGPGDHHVTIGQARIATEKVRDKHDLVIVQEKLDGSNVSVAKLNGEIIALTRSGYLAETSQYKQHQYFDVWVKKHEKRFNALLNEGERICGEWLVLAHGTKYNLPHEPFVAFDIMLNNERLIVHEFYTRAKAHDFITPRIIHTGSSFAVSGMIEEIKTSGHGAIDEVEGAIWRIERKGKVDFLCKYVHHHKQDGKYFAEFNNGIDTWNCDVFEYL